MGWNFADKGYADVNPASADPSAFSRLPPDGYVCRIFNAYIANSKAGNPMLILWLDIDHGNFEGYFKAAYLRAKKFKPDAKWLNSGVYRQLLFDSSGRVSPFLKGLLTLIQQSNNNFAINLADFDPDCLRGKLCGFIFALEEFKFNGQIKTRLFPAFPKSAEDIYNSNFVVPDTKKISDSYPTKPQTTTDPVFGETSPVDDDDVPF